MLRRGARASHRGHSVARGKLVSCPGRLPGHGRSARRQGVGRIRACVPYHASGTYGSPTAPVSGSRSDPNRRHRSGRRTFAPRVGGSRTICVKMIRLPSGVQVGWVARVSFSPKCVTWVSPVPSGRIGVQVGRLRRVLEGAERVRVEDDALAVGAPVRIGAEQRGSVRIRGASASEPSALTTAIELPRMFSSVGGTGYAHHREDDLRAVRRPARTVVLDVLRAGDGDSATTRVAPVARSTHLDRDPVVLLPGLTREARA